MPSKLNAKKIGKKVALGVGKQLGKAAISHLKKKGIGYAKKAAIGAAAAYSAPLAGSLIALDQAHHAVKSYKNRPQYKTVR